MKLFFAFIFIVPINLLIVNLSISKMQNSQQGNSCFSTQNYDVVYKYMQEKIAEGINDHFKIDDYELYLVNEGSISVIRDNYTLAVFNREKEIYSLAKILEDNQKLKGEGERLFCRLVEMARLAKE